MELQEEYKSEFAELREKAGLSIEQAASITKSSVRAAYRHDRGECSPSPLAIDTLRNLLREREPEKYSTFTFIDLFAGIGGLRIGFEAMGGKCLFTSEWDKYSNETYRRNFPHEDGHIMVGDIRPYTDPTKH